MADAQEEKRLDTISEHEVRRGFRIKELPAELLAVMKEDGLTPFATVRFRRLNPALKAKLSELVQRRYHADLKNPDILSNDQLRKLNAERGEWNDGMEKRMAELQVKTSEAMGQFYRDGIGEAQEWLEELREAADGFVTAVDATERPQEEKDALKERFDRWLGWRPERKAEYDTLYAAKQELPEYSVDRDYARLLDAAPGEEAVEQLATIDSLNERLRRFEALAKDQRELNQLKDKYDRIFSESVESRRENTEEMARLWVTCEKWEGTDESGKSGGPLAASFDKLYETPYEVLNWLLVESYFFANAIPDVARGVLERFGFPKAESEAAQPQTGAPEASAESPAAPSSSPATPPPTPTVSPSSA